MLKNRKFNFFWLWRWTVELFSLVMVISFWNIPKGMWVGDGLFFWWYYFVDASIPVIVLLFVTAIFCWRSHRRHAVFGLVLCLFWLIWVLLPRI